MRNFSTDILKREKEGSFEKDLRLSDPAEGERGRHSLCAIERSLSHVIGAKGGSLSCRKRGRLRNDANHRGGCDQRSSYPRRIRGSSMHTRPRCRNIQDRCARKERITKRRTKSISSHIAGARKSKKDADLNISLSPKRLTEAHLLTTQGR